MLSQRQDGKERIDASYLCLKCRSPGHLVQDCLQPWSRDVSDHTWAFSPERSKLLTEQIPVNPSDTLCGRCRELDIPTMFEGKISWTSPDVIQISAVTKTQHYRNLGQVATVIFRRDCPLCICLFALAPCPTSTSEKVHVIADWAIHRLERLVKISLDADCQYDKCILVTLSPPDGEIDLTEHQGDALGLLREDPAHISLTAQLVDPQQFDLNLVKRYLSTCERLHPVSCSPRRSSELEEIFLVDVETRKLVLYPGDQCEYLALSYVWGFKYQAHFSVGQILPKLPQTIEDAVVFCHMLGKRYLWADVVCIDQNNKVRKLNQIRRMSSIYQGAYASIVALSGSSMDSGLARLNRFTKDTQPQLSCYIGGKSLVGLMPTLSQQTQNTSWGSRAWTLQEALLSCRCIYFSQHQVYFECDAMQCCESLDERTSWIHQSQRGVTFDDHIVGGGTLRNAHGKLRYPLRIYGVWATLYSHRHMTDSSDALHAFSGILRHLQEHSYEDGFYWGLPEAHIDWALLWCGQSVLVRRIGFPSWSWAGWKGGIWPGWPHGPPGARPSWTHFYAWKFDSGRLVPVYPHSSPTGQRTFKSNLFHKTTIFDTLAEQRIDNDVIPHLDEFPKAEKEGYLLIDCAICSFDFVYPDKRTCTYFGPYEIHDVMVNSLRCRLRSVTGALEYLPRSKVSQLHLALTAREQWDKMIHHHFIQLKFRDDGTAVRKGILSLIIPYDHPEALDGMNVVRNKVILT